MTKLTSTQNAPISNPDATEAERTAIKTLIDRAQKLAPGTRVRYVQREEDVMGTLLVISLSAPTFDDAENYALYAIAHDLEEQSGLSLIVTQSSIPTEGKQLLKLRSFLSEDKISLDAREPRPATLVALGRIFWRPAHKEYQGILTVAMPLAIIFVLCWGSFYMPVFRWAQNKFPEIFGSEVVLTSVPKNDPWSSKKLDPRIEVVRSNIDESIRQIDRQILSGKMQLSLNDKELQELQKERALLEKARKDLE